MKDPVQAKVFNEPISKTTSKGISKPSLLDQEKGREGSGRRQEGEGSDLPLTHIAYDKESRADLTL